MTAKELRATNPTQETLVEAFEYLLSLGWQPVPANRDPRSDEYKAGVMAILEYRLEKGATPRNPYVPGTAQADAWSAGTDEGHAICREWMSGE